MTRLRLASFSLVVLLATSSQTCGRGRPATEPFRFRLGASDRGVLAGEVWNAIVNPVDTSGALSAAFRFQLAPPARMAPAGVQLHAVIRRGDPNGMTYLLVSLGATFARFDQPGGMTAIALVAADSVPLALTVQSSEPRAPWTALAVLPNGGRFEVALDSAAGRGEFRSVGKAYDRRVFLALAALAAPRQ